MPVCPVCNDAYEPGASCPSHPSDTSTQVFRVPAHLLGDDVPTPRETEPIAGGTAIFAAPKVDPPVAGSTAVFAAPKVDAPVAGSTAVFAAPKVDAPAATAQFRLSMPPPAIMPAGAEPPGATATFRAPVPPPATSPDSEATATFRVAVPATSPDHEATSTFRVAVPATDPDHEATSTLRVAVPATDPDHEATSTLRVAVPATDPDHEATAMIRVAVPASNPDHEATATLRVPLPAEHPDAVATAMRHVDGDAPTLQVSPVAPAPKAPPAPAAPKKGATAGRVLGGRFEVSTFLGSGTFGSTWVATDKRLKRECVVKILRPMSSTPSPLEVEMRRRFANEAVTLAHLIHPNITQVFDHGEEPDGTSWIAMEYVQGTPLSNIGREERTLDPLRVANIAAQLSAALGFAHSRGIVHRDLKPDNILILREHTGGEVAKVLDFGIARITDPGRVNLDKAAANLTQVGAFLGTPAFMSPEQAEGTEVGPESDVYSLGVLLYLLITGVLPGNVPSAWNPMTTIAYVHSPFEPVRKLRPDCPPVLAEFVERMLVKDPKARTFAAARASQELGALVAASSGHRTVVSKAAQPEDDDHLEDTPKRTALVAGLVALAVVGGGIVGLVYTQGRNAPPAPAPVAELPAVAPAPPPVDPRVVREVGIQTLLSRARAGAPVTEIDAQAREFAAGGEDARLALARGIAHKEAKSWDLAVTALGEAEIRGAGSAVGDEATTLKRAVFDAQAAQRAETEKREKKKRPSAPPAEVVRPEY